jgi:hypothetical protein
VVVTKWVITGWQQDRCHAWDKSSYCQHWQLHLTLTWFIYKGCGNGGMLAPDYGDHVHHVVFLRQNCVIE